MIALILDIISSAAILFIISSGLLIIFGVMKILNFAHAGLLSVGGYMALTVTQIGWSPWLAAPLALAAGFLTGALIEQTIMRWLYTRSLDAILAAWGLVASAGPYQTVTIIGACFLSPGLSSYPP